MRWFSLAFVVGCLPPDDLIEACDTRECPDVEAVDCMPGGLSAEQQAACEASCASWLQETCGVSFSF